MIDRRRRDPPASAAPSALRSPAMSDRNDYMEQVLVNQVRVEDDLRAKKRAPSPARQRQIQAPAAMPRLELEVQQEAQSVQRATEATAPAGPSPASVDVKITGWWRWKTVIVPPNAHVVHTRRGVDRPLHIGLGVSFRFNPATDSFLVVPGTMQTILINAYCICRELQGLLVQGYVQWIVADFATAYKKLDFSDVEDPMRVVNVQLREQAEAAIKDKVATMGIDEVLSDKQPIIEELTARLRHVAEGSGDSDKGLGLRIVTVQIKEAVVSSRRVWENLQKPFRAERARIARLAEIETERVIAARERAAENETETSQLESEAELDALRAAKQAEAFDREQAEAIRRVDLDKERIAKDADVARLRAREHAEQRRSHVEAEIAIAELERAAAHRKTEAELELLEARQRIANATTPANLHARLIEALPLVAEKLPHPAELRSISIGGAGQDGALASLVAQVLAVLDGFRARQGGTGA
jgi:flotillin